MSECNLAGANLYGARLQGAILTSANLRRAQLGDADLSYAEMSEAACYLADLGRADLTQSGLRRAQLHWANLTDATLVRADLHRADLTRADLAGANLRGADLSEACLDRSDLTGADLTEANLFWAGLTRANLVETRVEDTTLDGCMVYGTSAWNLKGVPRIQRDLTITGANAPAVTVDNLEVAQFVHLLLTNSKIRSVIDTVTSKVVLILGRFSPERKPLLDSFRNALRDRGFVPVLFDFDGPESKDATGTVETLARLARFIVADLTDPSSIPHELATIVPNLRTTPVVPLRSEGSTGYGMFDDLLAFPWVLEVYEYPSDSDVRVFLQDQIIDRAEAARTGLLNRR